MTDDELVDYEYEVATLMEAITMLKTARDVSWAKRDEPPVKHTQSKKPLHEQAAEIRTHIVDRDYGLAEKKATILCECLAKGDWVLGS